MGHLLFFSVPHLRSCCAKDTNHPHTPVAHARLALSRSYGNTQKRPSFLFSLCPSFSNLPASIGWFTGGCTSYRFFQCLDLFVFASVHLTSSRANSCSFVNVFPLLLLVLVCYDGCWVRHDLFPSFLSWRNGCADHRNEICTRGKIHALFFLSFCRRSGLQCVWFGMRSCRICTRRVQPPGTHGGERRGEEGRRRRKWKCRVTVRVGLRCNTDGNRLVGNTLSEREGREMSGGPA